MRVLVPVVFTPDGRMLLAPHFGGAQAYVVLEVDGGCRVVDRLDVGAGQPGGRGRLVVGWAIERGVEAVAAREIGPGAFEGFLANGIRVYYAESLDPCEAARAVAEGRARPLEQPTATGYGLGAGHGGRGHGRGWGRRWTGFG